MMRHRLLQIKPGFYWQVGGILTAGYIFKWAVWDMVSTQVKQNGTRLNSEAHQTLAEAKAQAERYRLPPMTAEQQTVARELRAQDRAEAERQAELSDGPTVHSSS